MNILQEIIQKRRGRIRAEGHSLGVPVPEARRTPIVPFGRSPFVVCEIKRRSPSKGWISEGLNAADRARAYARRGIGSISVLTEEDHFAGSLKDLMEAKAAVPDASFLRKDFLLDEEDIEISYKAGADAVLLIAAVLSARELSVLAARAAGLGMEALVEVHDEEDVRKASGLKPPLVGINSRDLARFTTDLLHPVRMRSLVDWPARLVFESGIRDGEDAALALSSGFDGILAGESVVRDERIADGILSAFGRASGSFWKRACARMRPGRPLVKICGIAREEDGRLAAELGADVLGFVLAPSPRRADPDVIRGLRDLDVLKVAVVAGKDGGGPLAASLYADGLIDAVQFHGDESPQECSAAAFPYYKAVRVGGAGAEDVSRMLGFRCPRVLVDAASPGALGGTGRRVPPGIVAEVAKKLPLWLAGGIGPGNVREICRDFSPELIDASSGLESAPGRKDPRRLMEYFKEIHRAKTP